MPPEAAVIDRRGPSRGDRRRQKLLDAVEELLRQRSIAELSVEDVAAAAGLKRSGFYFYFESKYAALGAVLATVWDEMADAAAPFLLGTDEPPSTHVRRTLADVAAVWRRHEHLLVAMFEASTADPGARELWDRWIERWVDRVAERIEAERASGRALPGPDAQALASVLLLMNERSYYMDRRRGAPAAETESMVEALAGVWLAAVWGER